MGRKLSLAPRQCQPGPAPSATGARVVQEVLLRVWRKAAQFEPSRGKAEAWLYTIARNTMTSAGRRPAPTVDPADPTFVRDDPLPDAAFDAAERVRRLRRALDQLPEEQAVVLRRSYYEGQTLQAIADDSGVPLGTVKSRVRLAMQRLRKALDE